MATRRATVINQGGTGPRAGSSTSGGRQACSSVSWTRSSAPPRPPSRVQPLRVPPGLQQRLLDDVLGPTAVTTGQPQHEGQQRACVLVPQSSQIDLAAVLGEPDSVPLGHGHPRRECCRDLRACIVPIPASNPNPVPWMRIPGTTSGANQASVKPSSPTVRLSSRAASEAPSNSPVSTATPGT